MPKADKPQNEEERLQELYSHKILDTLPEEAFDDITAIAAQICDAPVSLISLIDSERQWFKSKVGFEEEETHRDYAFCAYAILNKEEVLAVKNAKKDERFAGNPMVKREDGIVSYYGLPLVSDNGFALGTLCIIDVEELELSNSQLKALRSLANQAESQLKLRKTILSLRRKENRLENLNKELDHFNYIIAHDLKSPLKKIQGLNELLKLEIRDKDDSINEILDHIHDSVVGGSDLIDSIIEYNRAIQVKDEIFEPVSLNSLIEEVMKLVNFPSNASLKVKGEDIKLYMPKVSMVQVLLNLFSNSIKYNDKSSLEINIKANRNREEVIINFCDNGPGFKDEEKEKAFGLFETLGKKGKEKGTGIGLASVKRIIENFEGEIKIESEEGKGACFNIKMPSSI